MLASRLGAALIVALALNAWLICAHPLAKMPTANLDTGEVSRSVTAYRQECQGKKVVFIGSSLVLVPMMQSEAGFVGAPIPRMSHRRSLFVEHQLAQKLGAKPQAYCLAIGGEMVSDAYWLVKNILRGPAQPDAIVFGIAPRDVQDNMLPGVHSSESFRALAQMDDVWQVLHTAPFNFEGTCDLFLSQGYPLWKYRADLRTYYLLRSKKLMEACLPWVVFDKYGDTLELKPRRHGQFPEEVKGVPMIAPGLAMDHYTPEQTRFQYIKRYNPPKPELIGEEFDYLDRLLALCNQRGVKVLLVNMPLSMANQTLMPPGFYADYLARVHNVCVKHGIDLQDLCHAPYTDNSLFVDGVHLKPECSPEILSCICRRFADSPLAASLKAPVSIAVTERAEVK